MKTRLVMHKVRLDLMLRDAEAFMRPLIYSLASTELGPKTKGLTFRYIKIYLIISSMNEET
jgi:hypothetical protein